MGITVKFIKFPLYITPVIITTYRAPSSLSARYIVP